jgi:hypothetical protein
MIKKYILVFAAIITLLSCERGKEVYLFSTFREPATDGLYLAWSEDGYHWNGLGGPYLKSEVGTQPVMRDPSAVRASDLTYHMVWTSSWKDDQGFGYASSKDLIRLFLDPGFSVIDAVIVKRGTKDYVLVLKDNTRPNRNLRVAFSDSPLGPYTNISDTFTRQYTEGPTVIKKNNEWLIYFEAYREKVFGVVKTSDFKSFTDISNEITLPTEHKHGTIFKADTRTVKTLIEAAGKKGIRNEKNVNKDEN